MLPLKITLTPTMISFDNLPDEVVEKIKHGEVKYNFKNKFYVKGKPEMLYKIILELSYEYDIEIV